MGGANTIKEAGFFVLSLAYLCYALATGNGIVGIPLLLVALYATMTAMWSTNVEQSWRDIARWWALYGFFLMVSTIPMSTALILSVVPIPFFVLWGFLQELGHEPLDSQVKSYNRSAKEAYKQIGQKISVFCASIGNTNHCAAFLAPYAFISLWLAVNVSPFYGLLIPPILFGVYLTRCYSAMLGIVVGSCFIYPQYSLYLLPVLALTICALLFMRHYYGNYYNKLFAHKEANFIARIYYFKIVFELWKKNPIFGSGVMSFRREIYDCQAEMNVKKHGALLGYKESLEPSPNDVPAKYSPYPTRAHNDVLEMLSDGGIIGCALLLLFIGTIIYSSVVTGNYILLGGLICLMVHGFFFYTLASFSYVPYILLAAVVSSTVKIPYLLPWGALFIAVVGLIKLTIDYVIKPQLSLYWTNKAETVPEVWGKRLKPLMDRKTELEQKKKDPALEERELVIIDYEIGEINKKGNAEIQYSIKCQNEWIDKAINYTPCDGRALAGAVNAKVRTDPWLAMFYMERAIHLFDGQMRYAEQWAKYGELQRAVGNWEGAKRSLQYALYINPRLYELRDILKSMINAEQEKATRNKQIDNLVKPKQYLEVLQGGKQ
jgi:hypothetical protein